MTISQQLTAASEKFQTWMQQQALPLWSTVGIEDSSGCSFERILADGKPDVSCPRRTRVQARQMFTFAAAAEMHWLHNGEPLVDGIQAYLNEHAKHLNHPQAYAFQLDNEHAICDQKLDTYDCAFFLLAWAYQAKVFQSAAAEINAEKLMNLLDTQFPGQNGGWLEGDYSADVRRQNPHMHLFEAVLVWCKISANPIWMDKAQQIYTLFETVFYQADSGLLYEFFKPDWSLVDATQQVVEPGHLMEWVWLLNEYQSVSGVNTQDYRQALYNNALQKGLDTESGLLVDSLNFDGSLKSSNKRLWTVTEMIKAHITQSKSGNKNAEIAAAKAIEALMQYHLCTECPGFFIERLDAKNQAIPQPAPATSMYHLMMACLEVVQYCQQANKN